MNAHTRQRHCRLASIPTDVFGAEAPPHTSASDRALVLAPSAHGSVFGPSMLPALGSRRSFATPEPPPWPETPSWPCLELGHYRARLACSLAEREAACRLRFEVFNLELGEGLVDSYSTGLDQDQFDLFCDHLIVEDLADSSGARGALKIAHPIVGTYRMQSGPMAARNVGYYSAQEFDFAPYEPIRDQVLELGRASIHQAHRSSEVLTLLWRGIAQYSRIHNLRYMIGCSSLNGNDAAMGWATYRQLANSQVGGEYRTVPTPAYTLPADLPYGGGTVTTRVPKLLRTYIGVGAKICGPPAWDRAFGTIDFLTLLDLTEATPAARARFLIEGPGVEVPGLEA